MANEPVRNRQATVTMKVNQQLPLFPERRGSEQFQKVFKPSKKTPSPNQHSKVTVSNAGISKHPERDISPTTSAVTARQEEFLYVMESSLLNQNRNLQDHNIFLVSQIKSLFQREKKYVEALRRAKRQNKQLSQLNHHLQQQLDQMTTYTFKEIERMQVMIKSEKIGIEGGIYISSSSEYKSEVLGWETEETLNQNLQELKAKVTSIVTEQSSKKYYIETEKNYEKKESRKTGHPPKKYQQGGEYKSNELANGRIPQQDQGFDQSSQFPVLMQNNTELRRGLRKK